MLKLVSEVNGIKTYSGITADVANLPVNPQTGDKISHQGDTATIWKTAQGGGTEHYGFDETNNVWIKG